MNTDQLIAKLDELIAATRSAAIPANMRWLSAESMAAMLDMSPRQFAERLACKPGFPRPAREGHPRWNVAEVVEGQADDLRALAGLGAIQQRITEPAERRSAEGQAGGCGRS